jgi:dihydropyrimidinase
MYDLLVTGGTVVTATMTAPLDVAVQGERIAALGVPGSFGTDGRRVVDAEGCLVLPGGVDPHCHYRLEFEGILTTESQEYSPAAAYGGTTTIIDFADQLPPKGLIERVEEKKAEAAGSMAVDYGLHAILCKNIAFEVLEEIGDVIRGGIPTIKTFMTYGYMSDDGQRYGAMREVAEHGGMSVVHAEDDAIANWLTAKYVREGKTHGAYIAETRGPLVEEAAVRRAMLLAERAGSPLYVLHIGAGSAVEALAESRARGLPFYGETILAYLSFTADDLWDETPIEYEGRTYAGRGLLHGNFPTIKFDEDRQELWRGVLEDRIQVVSTDHCLINVRDRFETMGTTIESMQGGQAAVELRVPVLYQLGVVEGRIGLNRFVELVSTNPAKIMGLYPRKGDLAVGADADIAVLDPNRRWTVRSEDLHMTPGYSVWDGYELEGRVATTILRGSVLVENEVFVGSKTGGEFVPRTLLPEIVATPPDFQATHTIPVEAAARGGA